MSLPLSTPRRRVVIAAATVLIGLLGFTACQPPPGALPGGTAPDCRDMRWGSVAKSSPSRAGAPITDVRAGRHTCFDRLVIDLGGAPAAGWHARYHAVQAPGSGAAVALRGGAALEVIVHAAAYGPTGAPTYRPRNRLELADVSSFGVFRQVALAGSFEGETTFGIGVRSRLPFRVFTAGDQRHPKLVVDVGRRWP